MPVTLSIEASCAAELHAEMLALLPPPPRIKGDMRPEAPKPETQPAKPVEAQVAVSPEAVAEVLATAEVVPIAERKKPGRPKKSETVVDAEPAKNPEPTVEDARAVLKEVQTKIGSEEARQLNKKHGEEPLSEKKPAQWAAIIAEGKTLLAALDAE